MARPIRWRSGGRFLLAVDGTGLWSFRERHCPHCVKTEHASGAATYSHKLLVAFIISSDGYALPVACEFIENPGEAYDKQDCETQAFHRLQAKLLRLFPQTPFRLLLDALYADRNVMAECAANGWDFAITFKESDMPALWREAQALLALEPGNLARVTLPAKAGGGSLEVRWAGGLDYHGLTLSAVFQTERDRDGKTLKFFAHLTLRPVDRDNCLARAADGRLRWRCENEGFNTLKNGGFALEHVYSRNENASKCYVLLMLLAHIVQQLVTRGRLGAAFDFQPHRHGPLGALGQHGKGVRLTRRPRLERLAELDSPIGDRVDADPRAPLAGLGVLVVHGEFGRRLAGAVHAPHLAAVFKAGVAKQVRGRAGRNGRLRRGGRHDNQQPGNHQYANSDGKHPGTPDGAYLASNDTGRLPKY